MKKLSCIFCISFFCNLNSQTKIVNIETYKESDFPYSDFYTCLRIGMDGLDCFSYQCNGDVLEITFTNCSPDEDDNKKQTVIDLISVEVEKLISTASCNEMKDLYLLLGEGIFIQAKDKLKGNKYFKKGWKLNLSRFVEKFGKELSEAFPKNKIYVVEWGW